MDEPVYLVASRQGLYAARRGGFRLLISGRFFGIVALQDEVFAFRHGAWSDENPNSGSIVRYRWRSGSLDEEAIMVAGLDQNCHQLEHHDGRFFLVDTLNQCILEFDTDWKPLASHQILPPAARESAGHAHLNSITVEGDRIWIMLHGGRSGRNSEIWEFDRSFSQIGRTILPCTGCHDIVVLHDGRLLTCLSPRGEIQVGRDQVYSVDELWTRGLAVGPSEIAVGSSLYGKRIHRTLLPGFLTFLDPAFDRIGRLYLPAAPTQVRLVAEAIVDCSVGW